MLYLSFLVTFGALVAAATPAGGGELPGSGAPTKGQFEACDAPPAPGEVVAVEALPSGEQAVRRAEAIAAVPSTPIVLVLFNASPQGSTPASIRDRS